MSPTDEATTRTCGYVDEREWRDDWESQWVAFTGLLGFEAASASEGVLTNLVGRLHLPLSDVEKDFQAVEMFRFTDAAYLTAVDAPYSMLEEVRHRLRLLVPLIERSRKHIVYAAFIDTIRDAAEIALPGTASGLAQLRRKAEVFLKDHLGEAIDTKVRSGAPLTSARHRRPPAHPLRRRCRQRRLIRRSLHEGRQLRPLRSIVGLDRGADRAVFADFPDDKRDTANQICFVTDHRRTYRSWCGRRPPKFMSPRTTASPPGVPEDLFTSADLENLFDWLRELSANADVASKVTTTEIPRKWST